MSIRRPLVNIWFSLAGVGGVAAQDGDSRSLAAALQNINGMSSVISLVPVLTGKAQNVKAIAARTFPCSLAVAGLGAGRVLSKLQMGLMLLSADLYRNLVGELSYYHHEYVNVFSPALLHVPTGTPERHSSNVIVNHNITEDYMVEAWFRTQGTPSRVELSQGNNRRVFGGVLGYLLAYAFETFIAVQNAATGTALPLIVVQAVSAASWLVAICLLQAARGQGKRYIYLNRLATSEYRCYQLATSGKHVTSAVLSTQLSNIREYNLFDSKYESSSNKLVGGAMAASGIIDIFATVLIVGLNEWAYGWLALQLVVIAIKVFCSLEPIRRIPIVEVQAVEADPSHPPPSGVPFGDASSGRTAPSISRSNMASLHLPILINSDPAFSFVAVCVAGNVVLEHGTSARWHSQTPGIFIGQPYYRTTSQGYPTWATEAQASPLSAKDLPHSGEGATEKGGESVRYLAMANERLTLSTERPTAEANQALQREFLAGLAEVVRSNKVPSAEFLQAVEIMRDGIHGTMSDHWYAFGATDLSRYLRAAYWDVLWRRFL